MTDWKVPLAAPRIEEHELQQMADAYRSGWWVMGPHTEALETEMRDYTGAGDAVALSSCTAGLHLACLGAGLGPGDSVVIPSINFAATANMLAACGAYPRFADIKSVTEPWLDPEGAERGLKKGARAVITVAYGGHPGEVRALAALTEAHRVALIEDVAHAAGTWVEGQHVGTLGVAGAMSFSASKNLGVGEGGMLLTSDPELAELARMLRFQGITAQTADRDEEDVSEYTVERPGFNYRIDDPRAALVRARLPRLDRDNKRRAELDAAYRAALAGEERIIPTAPPPKGERNSHCMFTAVVAEGIDRDGVRRELAHHGVQTTLHFPPLHLTPAYADAAMDELPLTEEYARRAITLPLFPEMEQGQLDHVLESLGGALARSEQPTIG
jgi:dTDP-4-amino-4,6-dideoxygalactose transaminase